MLTYLLYRSQAILEPRSEACGRINLQARRLNTRMKPTGHLYRDASAHVQDV